MSVYSFIMLGDSAYYKIIGLETIYIVDYTLKYNTENMYKSAYDLPAYIKCQTVVSFTAIDKNAIKIII